MNRRREEMKDKQWLRAQIEEAKREVDQWPEWMKKIASFDGDNREISSYSPSTTDDAKGQKKVA
jgi:hypothetical protein